MCNRVRDLSTSGSSSTSDSVSSSNFSSTSCNDTVNNSDVQTNVIINEPSTSNLTSQVTGSCASKLSYFTPPHISIPTKVMWIWMTLTQLMRTIDLDLLLIVVDYQSLAPVLRRLPIPTQLDLIMQTILFQKLPDYLVNVFEIHPDFLTQYFNCFPNVYKTFSLSTFRLSSVSVGYTFLKV